MSAAIDSVPFSAPRIDAETIRTPRDAAVAFEGLLVATAFAPLAKAMGFYGDLVVASAARAVARDAGGALTDTLERALRP
jgi:hypothetical protein